MKARLLILLCLFGLTVCAVADEEPISIEATVNDKPVRFIFDTGSPVHWVLNRKSVDRLGLAVTNIVAADKPESSVHKIDGSLRTYTEICSLKIGGDFQKTWFWVLDWPSLFDMSSDGAFGWASFTNCVTAIDAENGSTERFIKVPVDTTNWVKLGVQTNCPVLRLTFPGHNGEESILLIDTGSLGEGGIKLNSGEWQRWKSSHKNEPTTIVDGYGPSAGIYISEEQWAKKISFGPLALTDVSVIEANSADVALGGKGYVATLGLGALKRVDLIVDALHNVAYLRPKKETPPPYTHNRAGVVFVPPDLQSSDLIAHVAKDSPAYTAGIRDGDLLLERDGRNVQNWKSDRTIEINNPMSDLPAGTKMTFTLKRGKKTFKATVVLKDILGPGR